MWSACSLEDGSFLHSGRNSETKEECINEAFGYIISDLGTFTEDEKNDMRTLVTYNSKQKEEYLATMALYKIVYHSKKLEEMEY